MENETTNASDGLREAMIMLNDKLDKQLNGDVVNDTIVNHIKKAVENVVSNHGMLDDMVKAGVPQEASEWMLFLFVVMQAGPFPEEAKTEEFKKGMAEFVKEHDLVRKLKRKSQSLFLFNFMKELINSMLRMYLENRIVLPNTICVFAFLMLLNISKEL